jgi:acyl transferase domain-containing protein
MTSLHEACNSVASGESSTAIVAGSNMIMTPTMTECMSENMVLSPDGECRTFDANANGYARSEAVNAIYIKKLDDAIRDGDPVRAVVRSTMANNNGKTQKLAIPSAVAQERLIRRAYQRAGISDPCRTGLFECHGTGTQAGDVTEAEVISQIFGKKGVHMGAVRHIALSYHMVQLLIASPGQVKHRPFRRGIRTYQRYQVGSLFGT